MIKKFDEFINEGLFDKLNGKKQIAEFQSYIIRACEKMIIQHLPDKYSSGKEILENIKPFAEKKYKEIVTASFAASFDKWWKEFTKYYEEILDETVKELKAGKGKYADLEDEMSDENITDYNNPDIDMEE